MNLKVGKPVDRTLPRIAVVGCGAAAREFCLPVLTRYREFATSIILVDNQIAHAQALAEELGIESCCNDIGNIPLDIDAAIVTTPHHLHAEQAIFFLQQGKPVFVEKPLGMSAAEVSGMLEATAATGAHLMVNNCRRLFPSYRRIQEIVQQQTYGAVQRISISDGSPFDWSSVSDFYVKNAALAKGVLLDRGAHTVDVVCWWLAGQPQVVSAHHDAQGGAEARMLLQLKHGNTDIQLDFSRLFKLENGYTIECEQAQISGRLFQPSRLEIRRHGRTESVPLGPAVPYHQYAWALLENFIDVVQAIDAPLFTAADVAASIGVIDQAYRQAQRLTMPWYDRDPNLSAMGMTSNAGHSASITTSQCRDG